MLLQFIQKGTAVRGVGIADSGYSSSGALPLLFWLVDSHWPHILIPGGDGIVLEEGNNWVDVLVKQVGMHKVLLEGGDVPMFLKEMRAYILLEHWVAPPLTEQGKGHVFME